jgi:hypothetical protein
MAQEKPLDLSIVQAWLSAWNEHDIFSDAAVRHLQSLVTDPFCLVVVTLGVGHAPRSLVFRRMKQMIPVLIPPLPALTPTLYAVQGDDGRFQLRRRSFADIFDDFFGMGGGRREDIRWPAAFPEMPVSPVPPVAPSVGQLWHQTGVRSETVPKLERILRWDGEDWVVAGFVSDNATIMKQGKQVCDFMEALASAHSSTEWTDCEFIYTYDGSAWGSA